MQPGERFLYGACLVGGVLCAVTPPNVRAVLLNVNPPGARGTMFAFYAQVDDIGKGGGPAVVAALIVAYGRVAAFNVAVSGWVVCGASCSRCGGTSTPAERASLAVAEEVRREDRERETDRRVESRRDDE